ARLLGLLLAAQEIGALLRGRLLPTVAARIAGLVRIDRRQRAGGGGRPGCVVEREGLQRRGQRTSAQAVVVGCRVKVKIVEGEGRQVGGHILIDPVLILAALGRALLGDAPIEGLEAIELLAGAGWRARSGLLSALE